jgi:pimeloyl-ACP methyl ester carboxylesterase
LDSSAEKQTHSAESEGATLVYDTQGAGAPLILIPGAGGDSSVFEELATLLSDEFRVITYDRRCNARSSGDRTRDMEMAQQARDVVVILKAAGHESAIVFGNSGGGNIALQLAADHPECVTAMLVHEAPVISVLPDAAEWIEFYDYLLRVFRERDARTAVLLLATIFVGFDRPVVGGIGQEKDRAFLFEHEVPANAHFVPNIAAIRSANIPTALLVGALSGDAYYARSCPILADQLGCPCVTVPGNHLAFKLDPRPFAIALRKCIAHLQVASVTGN